MLPRAEQEAQLDVLATVLRHAWVGTTLAIVHALWVWRMSRANGDIYSEETRKVMAHEHVRRQVQSLSLTFVYDPDSVTVNAERAVLRWLLGLWSSLAEAVAPALLTHAKQYVCFFDGGSRGNPGSGGAGAVLVAVDAITRGAEILWYAAMAYSDRRTTNNIAEYWGLVHGLQFAVASQCLPLHVVGDSSLILGQFSTNKRPKAPHLRKLQRKAARLAAEAGVVSWTHHLRAFNKMADAAANIAMDSQQSQQSRATDERVELDIMQPYLAGDIQHWFTRMDTL